MNKIKSSIRAVIIGGLLLLACVTVKGQEPPNAFVFLNAASKQQTTPGTINASFFSGLETATATATEGQDPYLYASATAMAGLGSYSGADLTYYFEVMGPAGQNVPIDVSVSGGAQETLFTGGNVTYSTASFDIQYGGVMEVNQSASATAAGPASFSFNQTVDISPNTFQEVDANAGVSIFLNATASANVDPQISIDPTFPDASEYTLVFSPNFPVPEPAAPALFTIGLGLAWLWRCTRKFTRLGKNYN